MHLVVASFSSPPMFPMMQNASFPLGLDAIGWPYLWCVILYSAARERPKLDKLSRAAISDAPRLDKAIRSQSDTESSDADDNDDDDDDDDDDEGFTVTGGESGATAEAKSASGDISVSWLWLK